MPKVTKEYVDEKKSEIVDAAIRVCRSKPAYAVTIRDVVKECGISQGGMYHYFSCIEEIFGEIVNRAYSEMNFTADADRIFESDKQPSEIIADSLTLLGEMMDSFYDRFGSLIFELEMIYLKTPEGAKKMREMFTANEDAQTFIFKVNSYVETQIANGHFKNNLPRGYISIFLLASLEGAKKISLISHSNPGALQEFGLLDTECRSVKDMMRVTAEIVVRLLG